VTERAMRSESDQLRTFRTAYEEGTKALNEGDIERAFGTLPDEIEWDLPAILPDEGTLHSRDEIVAFLKKTKEVFPDWRANPQEYIDAGNGRIVVRNLMSGTGQGSGVGVEGEIFQVWELRDGVPVRMREFTDRAEAFEAAGLTSSDEAPGA
jgi:uncharacterized protein